MTLTDAMVREANRATGYDVRVETWGPAPRAVTTCACGGTIHYLFGTEAPLPGFTRGRVVTAASVCADCGAAERLL